MWAPSSPAVGGADSQTPAFSADTLGQYLKSYEDVGNYASSGVPKCTGLVRPVFEMKPVQTAQNAGSVLQPGAPPGHSALWLATSKKIEVPANGFVFGLRS